MSTDQERPPLSSGFSRVMVVLMAAVSLVGVTFAVLPVKPNLASEPLVEGVYVTTSEIRGYTGTILELQEGRFRYWFYSDVGGGDKEYPETGTYSVEGDTVYLSNREAWTIGNVGSLPVLWRDDALEEWQENGRIYDYGILVQTTGPVPANSWEVERPSIDVVNRALQRPTGTWFDPFVYGPQ